MTELRLLERVRFMLNYNNFFDENQKKSYNLYIFSQLEKLALQESFLSKKKHTKKEWINFLQKLQKCNTIRKILPKQEKTLSIYLCNKYTICPICASLKRYQVLKSILPYYTCLIKLKKLNKVHIYEATATISGSKDLSLDYEKLRDSWTNFCDKGKKQGEKKRNGESSKIIGYIMSIEVTKNDKWHVHAHLLLFSHEKIDYCVYENAKKLYDQYGYGNVPKELLEGREYIDDMPVSKLTKEWFEATNGSINFFIRPLKAEYRNDKCISEKDKIYECIKYVTKISDLTVYETFQLWDELEGKKRVTKGGVFTKRNREYWIELLSQNNLLDEFLSLITVEKKNTFFEPCQKISYNKEYILENYSGLYDYHWYKSDEYSELLSERNRIIAYKKNSIKNIKYVNDLQYINDKNTIIDKTIFDFSNSYKTATNNYILKRNSAYN